MIQLTEDEIQNPYGGIDDAVQMMFRLLWDQIFLNIKNKSFYLYIYLFDKEEDLDKVCLLAILFTDQT